MSDSGGPLLLVLFQWRLRGFLDELCQFTVSDGEGFTCEPSRQWIEDLMPPRMLAVTDGVLAVGTISSMDVPVTIQWWNQDPGDTDCEWCPVTLLKQYPWRQGC
ncbi:hypothetical protein FHX42_001110 [Saccharopolyspora lacisalsi]|uniref:Uncharacterized protein n=1 Tax=Halosaccharopolyspora lacisalsi TaxID=1000566 RepID=A0A839DX46_9PSEU|nr:hypothetical protein [Halosaccharopolyspora lacisalsi]MBA8823781.1 hypothetical protein [Halosaccharopolyspora lacisalsi]